MSSHIGCPHIGSPFDFGWKKEGAVLTLILYKGLTTSEVISDLICTVRVKIIAWSVVPVSRMVCHTQNCPPVTNIDIDKCGNAIISEFKHDYKEEEEG